MKPDLFDIVDVDKMKTTVSVVSPKKDIFDSVIEKDLFDLVSDIQPKTHKPGSSSTMAQATILHRKKDVFDEVTIEQLNIKTNAIDPSKLTKQIMAEVEKRIKDVKPIEKVIEKTEIITEKQVQTKNYEKHIKKLLKKIKALSTKITELEKNTGAVIVGSVLPTQSGDGKVLITKSSANGQYLEWVNLKDIFSAAFSGFAFPPGEGIVFEPVTGTYYLLNCKESGELQTTKVSP